MDWRLLDQEKYLANVKLIKRESLNKNLNWHEHCEFCMEKIDCNYKGICYSTTDSYRWICERCFNDFKGMFKWEVVEIDK